MLADDHSLIRDALTATIRRTIGETVFGEATTSAEVVAKVEGAAWDLVVLDLGLPGGGEFGTLRRLRALRPELPILVLSMFNEEKMGVAAIEAGANGYLCKTADRALIRTAVAAMLAGRGYLSDGLRALLAQRMGESPRGRGPLSARELEVLLALGRGLPQKDIAAQLQLSASSVATYRTRIMEKLQLQTTADLQRYVVEHRLVHE